MMRTLVVAIFVAVLHLATVAPSNAQWWYPTYDWGGYYYSPFTTPVTSVSAGTTYPSYTYPSVGPYWPWFQHVVDPGARAWCSQNYFQAWACLRLG
jgi:hypothetical protein